MVGPFLILKYNLISTSNPSSVLGGGVGGHSALPFCTPVLYSRLVPPTGEPNRYRVRWWWWSWSCQDCGSPMSTLTPSSRVPWSWTLSTGTVPVNMVMIYTNVVSRDITHWHTFSNTWKQQTFKVDKDWNPSVLELNIKLAIYWQDFRLVIRWDLGTWQLL